MKINILTLFPSLFDSVFDSSILKRAQDNNIIKINIIDIRDFAKDKNKTVDDKPYGGGAGMVMKVDVIAKALKSIKHETYTILFSANGKTYDYKKARFLARKKDLTLICGHYEGIDARVEKLVDEVLSMGDYILTGGEIPAMAVVDSVTRFIPKTINPLSVAHESFENGLLEYSQYTRPENFQKYKVPPVLLSGDHNKIFEWRKANALIITKKNRPQLLKTKKV